MNLLAIESSGTIASVAVSKDGALLYEASLSEQLTHSQILLPMAERAMRDCALSIRGMDAFAVNIGPGSFTGLRIGICSANALAFAHHKPVIAIDSLAALAANAAFWTGTICPLIDARRDQVYAAQFIWQQDMPTMQGSYFAGSITTWLDQLPRQEQLLFLGDGAAAQREVIVHTLGGRAHFSPAHLDRHRAANLAYLAQKKLLANDVCAEALPLYLRVSQAERLRYERS